MKAIRCELCGGSDIVKQDGLFVCQHCGTKYSAEEVRKHFVTVTIDHSEDTEKLLVLARRAREEGNLINGAKYYELVMRDRPNDWEAVFYYAYFTANQVIVEEIWKGAEIMKDAVYSVIPLVKQYVLAEKRDGVLAEILCRVRETSETFTSVAEKKYARYMKDPERRKEYVKHMDRNGRIWLTLEETLQEAFPEKRSLMNSVQLLALENLQKIKLSNDPSSLVRQINRLEQETSRYQAQTKGGCYVATCVYGCYDSPQVKTLRRFRDGVLAQSAAGRAFIRAYYAVSPVLVRRFGGKRWFRTPVKALLDRLVARLER